MAVVHRTTMSPGKLELLEAWLPTRPWYVPTGSAPALSKAGGFRLDDPEGEVGIEFMAVTDGSGDRPVTYHVPLTYRGAPLDEGHTGGQVSALVGTSEHGVLGRRWIYDGAGDPVLVAQVLALLEGHAEPQAQSETDTPDPSVTRHGADGPVPSPTGPNTVADGPAGTEIAIPAETGSLTLTVARVLEPSAPTPPHPCVTAPWHLPDGTEHRSPFLTLRVSL
ncbi:maltokinase N-terminal cap-like domain-containing protein [Streptomyces sp. NPDC000229]|uniref:maltokinase N-terminal cap-like domain-containing protein n=1 Tax=Streptomyces sp. NPDC000229 TaxID=3154247 RepID=UPI003333255F